MTSRGAYRRLLADEHGRQCTICLEYKGWAEFYRLANGLNGHMPRCKGCDDLKRQGADLYSRPAAQ